MLRRGTLLGGFTAGLITLSLLLAFGFHSVQIEHEHYGSIHSHSETEVATPFSDTTEGSAQDGDLGLLGEKMHLTDKKLFLLTFTLFVYGFTLFAIGWQQRLNFYNNFWLLSYRRLRLFALKTFSWLQQFSALGKLNPRPH